MLHRWTSGGEAAALSVLKDNLGKADTGWVDVPVAGSGGKAAMTALRAAVKAGDPPTAVQMLGFDMQDRAAAGGFADISVAPGQNFDFATNVEKAVAFDPTTQERIPA